MAAHAHVSARIYGMIQGSPPFGNTAETLPARVDPWPVTPVMSFPTESTIFHPVSSGFLVGTKYVYGIIEVLPSGLQAHGQKYATDTPGATLATNADS